MTIEQAIARAGELYDQHADDQLRLAQTRMVLDLDASEHPLDESAIDDALEMIRESWQRGRAAYLATLERELRDWLNGDALRD